MIWFGRAYLLPARRREEREDGAAIRARDGSRTRRDGGGASTSSSSRDNVIIPQSPAGFVVRTEAEKAAFDNGFRLSQGEESGWLRFASTTARGEVWIAGVPPAGPWLLAVERAEVAAEIGATPSVIADAPGAGAFVFEHLAGLYAALDRAWRLGISLPDAPLSRFRAATAGLPRATEAERLVVQRIGQDVFREALLAYWGGRCSLTGIDDPALLRASHIVPWAECATDAERLNVHNGLLLSALWDAAFDVGLVSFADDGAVLAAEKLGERARAALRLDTALRLTGLSAGHRTRLAWHRARYGFAGIGEAGRASDPPRAPPVATPGDP